MTQIWSPSSWGRRFTGSGNWRLLLADRHLELEVGWKTHRVSIGLTSPLRIRHGVFWTDLALYPGASNEISVDGIPNRHGQSIAAAINGVVQENILDAKRAAEAEKKRTRLEAFQTALELIQSWRSKVSSDVAHATRERRWITQEQVASWASARPTLSVSDEQLHELAQAADILEALGDRRQEAEHGLNLWRIDIDKAIKATNEKHTLRELVDHKDLFDQVEKSPLTEEQSRAVICFDNRVQVVAAAGSGKTSTMVAKAAYATRRGLARPDQIVLLAFNEAAANELQARANLAMKRIGLGQVELSAMTFHSLGSKIIGEATGKKRRVPAWIPDAKGSIDKLAEIIADLKDRSTSFRTKWDMFRLVYGRDITRFGDDEPQEDWDGTRKRGGVRTLKGDVVKSLDELAISNWLFYNGVEYLYETDYEFDTATSRYTQYRPDFFYPDIGLYHEHYALNKNGKPPSSFADYQQKIDWKRKEHARRGTDCIETTSYQIWTGTAFKHLAKALEERGIALDPNPDRPLPEKGRKPLEESDLLELVRAFIAHAKSNAFDIATLQARLGNAPEDAFRHRHKLFLQLIKPIREAWDQALAAERGIDFEDMLIQAAEHVEQGRWTSPYTLVLADEFQDASWARARLALALVKKPGRHLFAVGDDWQSINRFAGADVSVMTGFRDWCGQGIVLKLEQTFRCPQTLCDVSSQFVGKNPAQLKKQVRSQTPSHGSALMAFQVAHRNEFQDAIRGYLIGLCALLETGEAPLGRGGKVSVYVLGRYRNDKQFVPPDWKEHFGDLIDIRFDTIHSSKGGEADYVILPGLVRGGFPNLRKEDPVLSLAMPGGDPYPQAEERRLFYVALTRARRCVAMFTVRGRVSPFLDELVRDGLVKITDIAGEPINESRCPECRIGVLMKKSGRYGPFVGCSNYPDCCFKLKQK